MQKESVQIRLATLAAAIRDVEARRRSCPPASVQPAWTPIPLHRTGIHELLADPQAPPLCLVADLRLRAFVPTTVDPHHTPAPADLRIAVWIGCRTWTFSQPFARSAGSSRPAPDLYIDPSDAEARLWAIDLAIRSPGVGLIIADGAGLDMASTRRLQLAAESSPATPTGLSSGPLVVLIRSLDEIKTLTAASTRWVVRPAVSPTKRPRWSVQLVRCKGVHAFAPNAAAEDPASRSHPLVVEWDHAQGVVAVSADVVDRSAAPSRASPHEPPLRHHAVRIAV